MKSNVLHGIFVNYYCIITGKRAYYWSHQIPHANLQGRFKGPAAPIAVQEGPKLILYCTVNRLRINLRWTWDLKEALKGATKFLKPALPTETSPANCNQSYQLKPALPTDTSCQLKLALPTETSPPSCIQPCQLKPALPTETGPAIWNWPCQLKPTLPT